MFHSSILDNAVYQPDDATVAYNKHTDLYQNSIVSYHTHTHIHTDNAFYPNSAAHIAVYQDSSVAHNANNHNSTGCR